MKIFLQVLLLLVRISGGGGSGIIGNIHMLVRKYLSHSDSKLNKLGVLGACALMEALDCERSNGKVSELERFICKVRKSISNSPSLTGLFYDELTNTVPRLTQPAVEIIYKMFVDVFESTYVGDEPAPEKETSDILCVESAETLNENPYIAYNLWDLIEEKSFEKIQLEWPLLKLVLSSCAAATDSNLKDVDSLLGCYFRAYPLDVIAKQYNGVLGLIAIINVVIELINGFSKVSTVCMRNKVTKRVINLTHLLEVLLMQPTMPSNLPLACFDIDAKQSKNKKTGSNSKLSDNNEMVSLSGSKDLSQICTHNQSLDISSKLKISKVCNYTKLINDFRENIREIDMQALRILCWNLPGDFCDNKEEIINLNISQIVFLLEDLLSKCKFKLKSSVLFGKESPNVGFGNLIKLSDVRFVEEVVSLLPALCHILEENVIESGKSPSHCEAEMSSTDDDINELETNPYKVKIFDVVFGILELVFNWSGFSHNTQISLQCFDVLGSRLDSLTQGPLSIRKKHALQYLMKYYDCCQTISSVIVMLKCCQRICYEPQPSLGRLAMRTLEMNWKLSADEKEGRFKLNEAIGYLVQLYITHSGENSVEVLKDFVEVISSVVETPKEPKKYPMFDKNSLPAIYKVIMMNISSSLRSISNPTESDFTLLDNIVSLFVQMITLIRRISSRPILRSTLVYGQTFLEGFLTVGMPLLNKLMKSDRDEVQALIKRLQACTRQLHHLTCHTKSNKDIALTGRVPLLKKLLETFVLRVKEMLAANNCTEAFWVGNLKQRNLKGEEIKSQVENFSDEDSESIKENEENSDNDCISELSVSSENEEVIDAKEESEDG